MFTNASYVEFQPDDTHWRFRDNFATAFANEWKVADDTHW